MDLLGSLKKVVGVLFQKGSYLITLKPTATYSQNSTVYLPDYDNATETLVGRASTDTLTNKRLTSPKLNEDVAVSATATEVNVLDGMTATTSELNYLDNDDLTAADLQKLADITSSASEVNKLVGFTGTVDSD